jgi:hypothetical protein
MKWTHVLFSFKYAFIAEGVPSGKSFVELGRLMETFMVLPDCSG